MTLVPQNGTLYLKLVGHNAIKMLSPSVALLYVKRHLIHEVTSPIAFDEINESNGTVRRPELCLAVPDHNIPTTGGFKDIADPFSRTQVEALYRNTREWDIELFPMGSRNTGIVHIVGPEVGFTLPGTSVFCGDSHTGTHGALAALASGIGTSEVRHALQTTSLPHKILKTRRITINGKLSRDAQPKDVIIHVINKLGAAGGNGYAYEFAGDVISAMSMSGRMTLCNMGVEGGAKICLIGVDETTITWVTHTPKFRALKPEIQERALNYFRTLVSDPDARFDDEVVVNAVDIEPMVTWGTSSDQSVAIRGGQVPIVADLPANKQEDARRAMKYMDLREGMPVSEIPISRVFIGSCTNGRHEDFRIVADIVRGRKVARNIEAWIVPGSALVTAQLEADGTLAILREAGFIIRNAGCSSCLAMNDDKIPERQHCISTSNRNFEGRQGPGACTHLVSPAVAAKSAIQGYITADLL